MKSIPLLRLLVPLCVGIGVGDYAFPWLFLHARLLLLLPLVLMVLGGCALFRRIEGKWLSLLTTTLAFSLGIVLLVHQQQERMTHYAAQNFTFRGIISEVPHRTPHGWRVTLRMRSPKVEEKWQVYLTDSTLLSENATPTASATAPSHVSALPAPQIGQEILAHGRVTPLLSNEGRTKTIMRTIFCGKISWLLRTVFPTNGKQWGENNISRRISPRFFHSRCAKNYCFTANSG